MWPTFRYPAIPGSRLSPESTPLSANLHLLNNSIYIWKFSPIIWGTQKIGTTGERAVNGPGISSHLTLASRFPPVLRYSAHWPWKTGCSLDHTCTLSSFPLSLPLSEIRISNISVPLIFRAWCLWCLFPSITGFIVSFNHELTYLLP